MANLPGDSPKSRRPVVPNQGRGFHTLTSVSIRIAEAVTEYRTHCGAAIARGNGASGQASQSFGVLNTAMLAFPRPQSRHRGISGSTGAVLGRSLASLRSLWT